MSGAVKRPGGPLRAAIYVRISKDSTQQGLGVARQLDDCRAYVDLARWSLDERWVLEENDTSATRGPRPKFERLLAGMRAGEFDVVVAFALDRLVRSWADSAMLHQLLDETGAHLATADRRIDTTSDGGALLAILSAIAQIEISNLRGRVKRKVKQNLEVGRQTNGGSRSTGWELDRKTVRLFEADAIRDVAQRIIDGSSLTSMCRYLTDLGILTPGKIERGHEGQPTGRIIARSAWTTPRLKAMLSLPRHAGIQTYKGEIQRDEEGRPRRFEWFLPEGGPDGEPVQGEGAPILDDETRDKLLSAIGGRSFVPSGWSNVRQHVLSGLVVCGVCERRMFVTYAGEREGRGPVWSYRCRGHASRSRDLLERHIFDQVIARANDPAHRWRIESWQSVDHAALQAQIAAKRATLAEFESDFLANGGSAARYARTTEALDAEIEQLEAGLLRELAVTTGVKWAKIDLSTALAESASLLSTDPPGQTDKLDRMDQQRDCFAHYVRCVKVFPSKRGRGFDESSVEIVWHEGQPYIDAAVVGQTFPWHLADGDTITVTPPSAGFSTPA